MIEYILDDGSSVSVDWIGLRSAHYTITDAKGNVLADGTDLRPSPLIKCEDEVMAALLAFIGHDAEMFEMGPDGSWGKRYPDSADAPDPAEYCFGATLAQWADEHQYELQNYATELENYGE